MSISESQNYSYLNAKVHAKKSRFLSAKDYERLYNASSSDELYRLISTTNFASEELNNLLLSGRRFGSTEIDQILIRDFQHNFKRLSNQLPRNTLKFIKEYEKRYVLDALKLILKAKHFGMSTKGITDLIVVPSEKYEDMIQQLIKAPSVANIIEQVPFPDYKKALQDSLVDYERQNTPLILELALFKRFYQKIWAASNSLSLNDKHGVFSILGTEIDLINVLAIVRAKKLGMNSDLIKDYLIPKTYRIPQHVLDNMRQVSSLNQIEAILGTINSYKELSQQIREIFETSDVSIDKLERKFKEYLVHKSIRSLSGYPFHLGIFFGYMHLAQVELSNMRAVIIGKMAGLSADEIKDAIIYF